MELLLSIQAQIFLATYSHITDDYINYWIRLCIKEKCLLFSKNKDDLDLFFDIPTILPLHSLNSLSLLILTLVSFQIDKIIVLLVCLWQLGFHLYCKCTISVADHQSIRVI